MCTVVYSSPLSIPTFYFQSWCLPNKKTKNQTCTFVHFWVAVISISGRTTQTYVLLLIWELLIPSPLKSPDCSMQSWFIDLACSLAWNGSSNNICQRNVWINLQFIMKDELGKSFLGDAWLKMAVCTVVKNLRLGEGQSSFCTLALSYISKALS